MEKLIYVEKSVKVTAYHMHALHSHRHYEIYCLQKGSRSLLFSNAVYTVDGPAVIVIPPHVMHMTEGGPFERMNIDVSPLYLEEYEKNFFQSRALWVFRPDKEEAALLKKTLDALFLASNEEDDGYTEKTLFRYVVYLLRTMRRQDAPPQSIAQSNHADIPLLVLKTMNFLNENFAESHTLDSLSKRFYCSKATLLYNFKKHLNCSPIDFLLHIRLTEAKRLLTDTKMSIGEISERCGFSSANYFGLIFKNKEQVSPANFRKQLVGTENV